MVQCSRLNKCGHSFSTRDRYPDAFGQINERFPATTADPTATADAYMHHVRGLDIREIRHWYRQGRFSHRHGDRDTATVVFDIAPNIFMERFVETVRIREPDDEPKARKQNFVGKHGGLWWQPPDLEIRNGDELWLVEACIDAVALNLKGLKAVATLSAGNFPAKALAALAAKGIMPRLIWALDNDQAGQDAIEQHVETARNGWKDGDRDVPPFHCRAALIPQTGRAKQDWNDVYCAGALDDETRAESLRRYRHEGDVFLAPSALERGLYIWKFKGYASFSVEFGVRTFWWSMDQQAFAGLLETLTKDKGETIDNAELEDIRWQAAERTAKVQKIANCTFRFLYYQKDERTDESWYYTRIRFPHGRHTSKNTFTGAQIASAAEFKKRLLAVAPGAVFSGATWQLDQLVENNMERIRTVDTVEFTGYSKKHRTYLFGDVAVSGGTVYKKNDEDFFDIDGVSVKSLNRSVGLVIGSPGNYKKNWPELVYNSFGAKGLCAAAWYLGSLFAEQIREQQKSYPFFEIVGEPGSGKSTLIEFLWKLLGRPDFEGFDPAKSTMAARARNMTQVANLPVSFIESDRVASGTDTFKQKQFSWDELKTAYNGRASRSTGIANNSNDTYEPPFRGSILISQNAAVDSSRAVIERIVHTGYDTSSHNEASKAAADQLATIPVEQLSYFLLLATKAEQQIMETFITRMPVHEAYLLADPDVRNFRIAKNHAQMRAMVDALAQLVGLREEWKSEALATLSDAARRRQATIATDPKIVEEFWENIEFLGLRKVNHAGPNAGYIALNLNHIISLCVKNGLKTQDLSELKTALKTGKSRPFRGIQTQRSVLDGFETVRAWTFEPAKVKADRIWGEDPTDEDDA
ncbi:toprim domain-containing protein (plasmid) [Azospirillum sp. HJ39]|uniref:toprim domain-containing protein n=1 Tax=Azospirillum sp. HJ39 TaxID=3159496 RepID=UPI003557D98D